MSEQIVEQPVREDAGAERDLWLCPTCGGAALRMSVTIEATLKPNDRDYPYEDESTMGVEYAYNSTSAAWCESCHWHGTAADVKVVEEAVN